jgi:ABC-2 type transport system permease protein
MTQDLIPSPSGEVIISASRSGLSNSARRIWALYKRHAYEMRHSVPGVVDMLFWPAVDLMLWGLLTMYLIRQEAELPLVVGWLIGGVLLWDFVFRTNLGIGVTFLDDSSWTHNILNLMVSPLRPIEYLLGSVAWSFTKVLAGWALMVTLAWALFSFFAFGMGVIHLAFFALALMTFGVAVGMIVLGICLRFGPGADVLAWALAVLLMPVSAVFYPVEVLPGWAQAVANLLPTAHVFEAMRTVLVGDPAPWGRLVAAMGLNVIYIFGALMFVRAMFKVLRHRGYVTRYMT